MHLIESHVLRVISVVWVFCDNDSVEMFFHNVGGVKSLKVTVTSVNK